MKEACLYCDKEFDENEMYWNSLVIDDEGDEDNFYACNDCYDKLNLVKDGWTRSKIMISK